MFQKTMHLLSGFLLLGYAMSVSATTLMDPTCPPGQEQLSPEYQATHPKLLGIFSRDGVYRAHVNGAFVKKGDHLGELTVLQISSNDVLFKRADGSEFIVPLLPTVITNHLSSSS